MWAQAGFPPGEFYEQTPYHFQLCMRGVRKRLENEAEARALLAYEAGAFGGLAYHGKLKAFSHYSRKKAEQTPQEMLGILKTLGAKSDMKITRVKLASAND